MSKSHSPASVKPAASVIEELARTDARQWQAVVNRVEDPITARLLVDLLDTMPDLRMERVGVYLAARETVKRDQVRYAKSFRCGKAAGLVVKLFISALTGTTLAIARGLRWSAKACASRMPGRRPVVASAAATSTTCDQQPVAPGRAGIVERAIPGGLLIVVEHFGDLEMAA